MSNDVWEMIPFTSAVDVMSDEGKRLKQRDYLEQGNIPVIDQGEAFIGGYTNDERMAYKGELPVIIFGDHTRRIKLVNQPFAVGADGVKILKPKPFYRPKFFYYFLQSLEIPSRGYSRHFQFLRNFEFVKTTQGEQDRIVAEIEKQFSRLDEAVATLKRIKANLKRYKAAVLKAAVEGKLTEQWRKDHPDVEPADQLLKRILVERRAKWEAEELVKMKAKGIKPKDDSWKKKYKEPVGPDTANLLELPAGWVWTALEQLLSFLRNGISVKPDVDNGLPILRISAVRPMLVKIHDVRYLSSNEEEYADYVLSSGDLLFTRYNGNPDLVGVCGVVPELSRKIVHPDKLIRCKLASRLTAPKYIANMANIGASRGYLAQRVRTTAGQAGISGTDLRGMPIPLSSQKEQQIILAEIDSRLSVTEELEATIETNLKRAERLRQTILKQAFSGAALS